MLRGSLRASLSGVHFIPEIEWAGGHRDVVHTQPGGCGDDGGSELWWGFGDRHRRIPIRVMLKLRAVARVGSLRRRGEDRLDDVVIAGATAQVAFEADPDFL